MKTRTKGRCTSAQTHSFTYIRALIHMHVGDRRRLKRSPTSIALAINAPSALGLVFLFIPRGTRDSALSTCASLFALSSTPFSHYSANVSGCYFFSGAAARVFFCMPLFFDHSSETFVFESFEREQSHFLFAAASLDLSTFHAKITYMQKLLRRRSLN
jgi:hypothetical protein